MIGLRAAGAAVGDIAILVGAGILVLAWELWLPALITIGAGVIVMMAALGLGAK